MKTAAGVTYRCPDCKETKPLAEYYKNRGQRNGHDTVCKPCKNVRSKRAREALSPQERRVRRRREHFQRTYGITLALYQELFASQGGCCAICGVPGKEDGYERLRVDHDHETGTVRGLLCLHCNTILGMAKDNPEVLSAASRYLHAGFKRLEW